ncbi:MAG: geranylgeranylglyceryl/heptaprenylglyceryl phosphate synthase [Pseudopedobacter saltans]|uniref:Geranylgeranylglyceryl phosphate synthase n=1 Tax=Pseudopedobacter saltans TaxID=151895 RepID=A0A2W5HCI5_9SPHI|nr:MAG: geranylgeranylglyceryl/heptaprenylglyceryl phosphate synthase [Pseudopedobacter saltans]
MKQTIFDFIVSKKKVGKKMFAVLIDPDKVNDESLDTIVDLSEKSKVDLFFIGGSLMVSDYMDKCIQYIQSKTNIPTVLFPGSNIQVSKYADALLYLSLISGRNADLLIGQHVVSAPFVKASGLEVIPTGYMVIDGGHPTAVSYMSNSFPIPKDKKDIALCTAMAGEMLGMKLIYMDAGSGAQFPISTKMIHAVSHHIDCPLIIGGGIRTVAQVTDACTAGADIIVVGNAIEKESSLIGALSEAVHASSNKKGETALSL